MYPFSNASQSQWVFVLIRDLMYKMLLFCSQMTMNVFKKLLLVTLMLGVLMLKAHISVTVVKDLLVMASLVEVKKFSPISAEQAYGSS